MFPETVASNVFIPYLRKLLIFELRRLGMSQTDIARLTGVTQAAVSKVLNKEHFHSEKLSGLDLAEQELKAVSKRIAKLLYNGNLNEAGYLANRYWWLVAASGDACKAHERYGWRKSECFICTKVVYPELDVSRGLVMADLERALLVLSSSMAELLDTATTDALIMGDIKFIHLLSEKIENAINRGVRVYVLSYSLGERGAKFILEDMPFLKKLRVAVSGDLVIVVDSERGGVLKARPTLPTRHGYLIEERTLTDYLSHDFMNRWVNAKVIVDEDYELPWRFTFHRMALYETKKLLLENRKLRLKVKGYEIDTGARVEIDGNIIDAVLDVPAGFAHFKVETDSGIVRVGGLDAIVEEVAGEFFEIYEGSKQ